MKQAPKIVQSHRKHSSKSQSRNFSITSQFCPQKSNITCDDHPRSVVPRITSIVRRTTVPPGWSFHRSRTRPSAQQRRGRMDSWSLWVPWKNGQGKKDLVFFKEELWMVFFYGFFGMEHNGTMLICMDYSLHSLLFIGLSNVIGAFLNVLQ